MSYYQNLNNAADWLKKHQNSDKGWGMSPGASSSIVNTAEAIYVLSKANKHHDLIEEGIDFILHRVPPLSTQHQRTRYVFFALFAFIEKIEKIDNAKIQSCCQWLLNARNKDGGWGHDANDEQSRLFPTCMSLMCLSKLNYEREQLDLGYNWLRGNHCIDGGWSFEGRQSVSTPTATALAVLTLRDIIGEPNENIFVKPRDILLTCHDMVWKTERENMPGTLWEHCTYMWIFPALISLGVEPYASTIASGVRQINTYVHSKDGWKEPAGGTTVRGQFWAVFAFYELHRGYDPAIHTYRIESSLSLSQPSYQEPEFVHILPDSSWRMVIPKRIYQVIAYLLLVVSCAVFLELHKHLANMPRWVDILLSGSTFGLFFLFVHRRHTLFPAIPALIRLF